MQQSNRHPDGWGVAYYNAGAPHVIKSVATAMDDHLFQRVSGIVASETVLAHLRKATQGNLSIINTHPFQFGQWVFVHNGNLAGFSELRESLLALVPPVLRRFILGDSDSELLFYLLLGQMSRRHELHRVGFPVHDVIDAMRETVAQVVGVVGEPCMDDAGPPDQTYLSFVLTNGRIMVAHQGGKKLFWSSHKQRCPDRDHCPSFGPECEAVSETGGFVKHLLVSSEPLQGDNVWTEMNPYEVVGVDWAMQLQRESA